MTRHRRFVTAALRGAFLLPVAALQAQDAASSVSLPFTRQYAMHSSVTGRDYRLSVAIPPDYATRDTTRYSVLYVLDGNDEFPIAVEAHRLRRVAVNAAMAARWPEIIIVGIGYPVDRYGETLDSRNSDYTPTKLAAPQPECGAGGKRPTGGGPEFMRVIREEIIPFVDARYRTSTDRGILGHSHGGLFAFAELLTSPQLFHRYAALSASLWWDHEAMFIIESQYGRAHKDPQRDALHVCRELGNSLHPPADATDAGHARGT